MQQPLVDGEGREEHAEEVDEVLYRDRSDPEGEVFGVVVPDHGDAGEVTVHDDEGDERYEVGEQKARKPGFPCLQQQLKGEERQYKRDGCEGIGFSPYEWQCYGIADQQYPEHIPGHLWEIEFFNKEPQHLVQEEDTVGDDEEKEPLLNGQSEEVKIFGVVVVETPDACPCKEDIPDEKGDRGKNDPGER